MKKFLVFSLMTMLCVSMAWGEITNVAQLGEIIYKCDSEAEADDPSSYTYKKAYTALNKAIAAAEDGQTVIVLSDVASTYVTFGNPTGRTVTLDLNGKTLSGANTNLAINGGNKLILVNTDSNNNGCINHTGNNMSYPIWCKANAEVEINNGVTVQSEKSNSIKGASGATITINGGTLTYAGTNTLAVIGAVGSTLNINGGSIIGNPNAGNTTGLAIQAKTSSTVNMVGGTITAGNNEDNTVAGAEAASSVYLQASTLTMTGGEIRSTTTNPALYVDGFSNVAISGTVPTITSTSGDIVLNNGAIVNNIKAQSSTTLTINEGATVSSTSGYAIEATKVGEAIPSITIDGGTVEYVGSTADDVIKCNGATLTMNSGRIESTTIWDAILVNNGSQVTINGGLVTNTSTGEKAFAININANTSGSGDPIVTTLNINGGSIVSNTAQAGYGVSMYGNGATLNMTDGSINATSFAITGNGTAEYGGTAIDISGGSLSSATADAAIYHPQAGTLTISGGTITGQTGIGIKGGTLTISGGTIHAVGSNGGRVEGYNNGLNPSFAAVQIESNPGYAGNMNITVSNDATLISDSWYAFYEYTPENKNPQKETKVNSISVTGGNFQGGILISQDLATKGGFVSGGKWSKDITANVAAGKAANPIDEDPYFFEVGNPTAATAEIVNDPSKNAVLTNEDGETYAGSYSSESVGDDAEVKTSTATNQAVITKNTDVVVDQTDEENSTVVEVKKVTVEGDAELNIKEGATLMVGSGSVLLNEETTTGGLTVEAGASLVVEGLVYGSTAENFVIEGEEDKSGIVLFSPETEFIREDHPKATYRFTSKSFRDGSKWVYQRFGMPSVDGNVTVKSGNMSINSYICTWDYEADDWGTWRKIESADGLAYTDAVPFQCYELGSTNAKNAPVTYDFIVDLMGNANAPLSFKTGWNPYANSYTAPIDIKTFLNDVIEANGGNILATIYLYKDLGDDTYTWQGINLSNVGTTYRVRENGTMVKKFYESSIKPMQAFIMKLSNGEEATQDIDYLNNVYNPAMGIEPAPAPARNNAAMSRVQIGLYNDMYWDNISLTEGEQFSAAEDNGYDAPKYNSTGLILYAINGSERMERVATDNLDGWFLGLQAPAAGTYTIDFSGVENFDYALIDRANNTIINIMEDGEYTFNAAQGENNYRFQIVAANKVPTAIDNMTADKQMTGVYSITGQYLGEDVNALPKGVYIINGTKVVK